MDNELDALRRQVVAHIRGGMAYDTFEQILGEFPASLRGIVPVRAERSAWQILGHMHITLADILEFSTNPNDKELNWPDDYWPVEPEPPASDSWENAITAYLKDRGALESLVSDANRDLFAPFSWGDGQTLLREALLAADHQSYHLGELVMLRRLLG